MSYEATKIRKAIEKGASQVSSKTLQVNERTKLNENLNELGKNIPVFQTWTRKNTTPLKSRPDTHILNTTPPVHLVIRQCSRWLTILG